MIVNFMDTRRSRLIWLLLLLVVLIAVGGVLLRHYSIRNGRAYAESVHGILFPASAVDIQTRRSGLGYERWGADNYVVSVFRMNESEFSAFTGQLSVVTEYLPPQMEQYPWPMPFDGFRAAITEFRRKYAMIDFSSPTGDGLRCHVWETDKGLFVRLTTSFF